MTRHDFTRAPSWVSYAPPIIRFFKSSPPGQNGHHFDRRHLQMHFLQLNDIIPIRISLKFVFKGSIDNKTALVQGMAWPGRRQAITWTNACPIHRRIYAALGCDELRELTIYNGDTSDNILYWHTRLVALIRKVIKRYQLISLSRHILPH